MGKPVRSVDLARDLIGLSRHLVEEIQIMYSGLRPGEKLFEELLAGRDATVVTALLWIRVAQLDALPAHIDELLRLTAGSSGTGSCTAEVVRQRLRGVVSTYQPVVPAA